MSTPITQGIQSSESQEVCILWYFTTQTSFQSSITIQPIASQVRVTGAQRGKMGVSLDRSSDWWRRWRDIFGGPITLRCNAAKAITTRPFRKILEHS